MGSSSPPLPPSLFLQDLWPPDGGAQSLNTMSDPRWLWVLCLQGPVSPALESILRLSVLLQSLSVTGQGCELSFYAGFLSNYQSSLVTVPFFPTSPFLFIAGTSPNLMRDFFHLSSEWAGLGQKKILTDLIPLPLCCFHEPPPLL